MGTRPGAVFEGRSKDNLTVIAKVGQHSWVVDCACGVSWVATTNVLKSKFISPFTCCNACSLRRRSERMKQVASLQPETMRWGTFRSDTVRHPEYMLNLIAACDPWGEPPPLQAGWAPGWETRYENI